MYIIKRNGKRYGKQVFYTYEEARSYARKAIRRMGLVYQAGVFDLSGLAYRNPAITKYGFEVEYNHRVMPWKATGGVFSLGF